MFRPSPFRNDPLFRNDPFLSSSFFPRPFNSPFSSLFDFPPVSAPLYYLTEDEEEPRHSSSRKSPPQQREEKYNEGSSKSSPSNQQMTTTGKKDDRMEGKRRTNPRSLLSPFFSSTLTPFTTQMPTMDMKVDMFSTPTAYSVHAAVPGLKKEDINITVQDGVLTIEAERREEKKVRSSLPSPTSTSTSTSISSSSTQHMSQNQSMESKEAGGEERRAEKMGDTPVTDKSEQMDTSEEVNYHHVESFYGRVSRSVQLPDDARLDELTAKYEDGVIKIEVPRTQDEKKQQRKIAIQ